MQPTWGNLCRYVLTIVATRNTDPFCINPFCQGIQIALGMMLEMLEELLRVPELFSPSSSDPTYPRNTEAEPRWVLRGGVESVP